MLMTVEVECNVVITEEEAKFCHHALNEICTQYAGADKKFYILRDKFKKLGYVFENGGRI